MTNYTEIQEPMPKPLTKRYPVSYFEADISAHFFPEVKAFFDDPIPSRDMVSGQSTGTHRELVAVALNGHQISRDELVAILGEAHVSQIEELASEGFL